MIKKPQIKWEYSLETEAKRLAFTASQIATGIYFNNSYLVLPKIPKHCQESCVIFPKLDYLSIKNFWQVAKNDPVDLPASDNHPLVKPILKLLQANPPTKPNFQLLIKLWNKAQNEIFDTINNILHFPVDNAISSITICPTNFGTGASFNLTMSYPADIFIYTRPPFSLHKIVEVLLTSLTRHNLETDFKSQWIETEVLADWLMTHSKIKPVIDKFDSSPYHPTSKTARRQQQPKIQKESIKYLQSLGIYFEHNTLFVKDNQIYAHNSPITNLTSQEKTILTALLKSRDQILNIDELGDLIFTDEKYSLYAISKAIQRLRDKLEQNNVPPNIIQTFRGQGYRLAN